MYCLGVLLLTIEPRLTLYALGIFFVGKPDVDSIDFMYMYLHVLNTLGIIAAGACNWV
jgi:hypothetical protein